MQCERCRSGAEAIFRVRTDILDMVVCAACANEARIIGIPVLALDNKNGLPPGMIRRGERNVGKLSRTVRC
jgi:hypothetical protein